MLTVLALPGCPPTRHHLKDSNLKSLQGAVGGPIELLSIHTPSGPLDVWVNEEGILLGLPFNRTVQGSPLVGPILVTASNAEGDTIGLSNAQADAAISLLLDSPAFYY